MLALAIGVLPAKAAIYYYDSFGRLQSVISDDGKQTIYSYDAAGNRSTVSTSTTIVRPPTAVDDAPTFAYGPSSTTFDPRSNDSDPGSLTFTITGITQPLLGSATFTSTSVTYTPLSFHIATTDTFTYTIQNTAGLSSTATINMALTNPAPIANPDTITYNYGSTAPTFDPRVNDSDPSGLALTITGVTAPQYGTASFTSTSVTYTPPSNHYAGVDTFTYTLHNTAGLNSIGNINVNLVNLPPVANNDSISVYLNGYTLFDPRVNDSDPGGNPLSFISWTQGAHGTVTQVVDQLQYTANSGYSGSDSFTYTIGNGLGGTATATVSVTVHSTANHAPIANNDSVIAFIHRSKLFNPCLNDSDPDGDPFTVISATNPAHGSLSFSGCLGTYTTSLLFPGSDSITYTISDNHGATATATVSFDVQNPGG